MTADLIVTGALVVAAAGVAPIRDGAVSVVDGRIARIGTAVEIGRDAREVVDAGGGLLAPGLVNAHCHSGCSLFRGLVEGLPLEPWLARVWKAEAAIFVDARAARLGARLGLAEQLLAGVTCVLDMYWRPRETVAAARELGMRIAAGPIFLDAPGVDGMRPEARLADARRLLDELGGARDVLPAVLPHGTYTVSPDLLVASRRLADAAGAIWSTHAAETRAEQADVAARYGRSVIRHLDALGLLGNAVLAHGVWLDDEEIALLARAGACVVHNPVSNLKLASGVARVPDLLAAGVRVALGTDGAISGNDLDPWLAMRLAATLHKGVTLRADAVTAAEAFAMATAEGAAALGAGDRIGTLAPGMEADMILLDLARPSALPLFDPVAHLVFSAARGDVRQVWIGGARVVRDGALARLDIAETLDEVAALAPRIAASAA